MELLIGLFVCATLSVIAGNNDGIAIAIVAIGLGLLIIGSLVSICS